MTTIQEEQQEQEQQEQENRWQNDIEFAKTANSKWHEYLEQVFETKDVVSTEKDVFTQLGTVSKGDFIVNGYVNVEVKTRRQWVYDMFGDEVCLETVGNIHHNSLGSSFLTCKAHLWGYGFLTENDTKLTASRLYYVSSMQEWFKTHMHEYQDIKGTTVEGRINSLCKAVPRKDLEGFVYKPEILRNFLKGFYQYQRLL